MAEVDPDPDPVTLLIVKHNGCFPNLKGLTEHFILSYPK